MFEENPEPFTTLPKIGEAVKLHEIGTRVDGIPYREKFFVTVKELPSELNDNQFVGILSNKLIYSKLKIGCDVYFKQKHIHVLSGRVHSIDKTLNIIDLLTKNPEILQLMNILIIKESKL